MEVGGPRTEPWGTPRLGGWNEVEEAAKVTELLQVRNWIENHKCVS